MILQSVPRPPIDTSGVLLVIGVVVVIALVLTGIALLISSATRKRYR